MPRNASITVVSTVAIWFSILLLNSSLSRRFVFSGFYLEDIIDGEIKMEHGKAAPLTLLRSSFRTYSIRNKKKKKYIRRNS